MELLLVSSHWLLQYYLHLLNLEAYKVISVPWSIDKMEKLYLVL